MPSKSPKADHPVLEQLRFVLRQQMNDLADHIAGGGCEDFNSYKHCIGMMEGYARAESELLSLDRKLANN